MSAPKINGNIRTADGYRHAEAFCLMWYACKCGHRERIWNSRDGVTPYGCACPSCGDIMDHVAFQLDTRAPRHELHVGQRFWRDGTPDEAEAYMRARINRHGGVEPERAARLIEGARSGTSQEFQAGWPVLDEHRDPALATGATS